MSTYKKAFEARQAQHTAEDAMRKASRAVAEAASRVDTLLKTGAGQAAQVAAYDELSRLREVENAAEDAWREAYRRMVRTERDLDKTLKAKREDDAVANASMATRVFPKTTVLPQEV